MSSFENKTHVFIVRMWREPREIKDAPVVWRGAIEHVMTGKRRYLDEIDDITAFIRLYLNSPDSESGWNSQI